MKYIALLLLALFVASCGSNPVSTNTKNRTTGETRDSSRN